ncbi:MAG: Asp-tRNA(Asn)/Glu-tRNA(Gln) amidotransferase subunit GatB [Elusimicrobia bacterium]|nr:Asp-tRNA(Asn)/Glu-tRNA(Gln) amidotransferase subunit GatB [Elusimicrobiota bacterium]
MDFESVIGLEIHVQIKSKSKMFCSCPSPADDAPANTAICPICTGQPGALPALNGYAVFSAIKAALALKCEIRKESVFARKNYFYPDLPKAYQISQYDKPLAENGKVELPSGKFIRVKRAHLEEDAAKSLHALGSQELDHTLVDFNRCGMPLLEIVSEPDIRTSQEAYEYLTELKKILRWADVSECDMEKGHLRCDVNISIRPMGDKNLGKKVEIKNLNSFKAAKDAIESEIKRQKELFLKGEEIAQDTRLWNEKLQQTISMRSKEMAHDYRYFPEPDLPPLILKDEEIEKAKKEIGELPVEKAKRYISEFSLTQKEAAALSENKHINSYFENILSLNKNKEVLRQAVNLIMTQLFAKINELKIKENEIIEKSITAQNLLQIAELSVKGEISSAAAKKLFEICWDNSLSPAKAVEIHGLKQSGDIGEIEEWVKEAVSANPEAFTDFKNGNEKASGPIVGFVMKKSKGKANPKIVGEILKKIR